MRPLTSPIDSIESNPKPRSDFGRGPVQRHHLGRLEKGHEMLEAHWLLPGNLNLDNTRSQSFKASASYQQQQQKKRTKRPTTQWWTHRASRRWNGDLFSGRWLEDDAAFIFFCVCIFSAGRSSRTSVTKCSLGQLVLCQLDDFLLHFSPSLFVFISPSPLGGPPACFCLLFGKEMDFFYDENGIRFVHFWCFGKKKQTNKTNQKQTSNRIRCWLGYPRLDSNFALISWGLAQPQFRVIQVNLEVAQSKG